MTARRWWKPSTWLAAAAVPAPAPRPLLGVTSLKARRATQMRYDGARVDHLLGGWVAGSGDAASESAPDLARLRNRAREGERNRALMVRALEVLETAVVGAVGARPLFETGDARTNKQLADLWRDWCTEASASDRLRFEGLTALALRSMVRDGEALARIRTRRLTDVTTVPIQLEVLEADFLATEKSGELANGAGRIINGVETDAIGRIVAYWIHRRHPGDYLAGGGLEPARVPAEAVVHTYRTTRAGQRRGVSWFAPVLDAAFHHTELRRSERVRFRASASVFATVEGADDETDDGIVPSEPQDGEQAGPSGYVEDGDGNPVNNLAPGGILNVTHGKALKLHQPAAAVGYGEAIVVEERDIARGLGLMYEALSGDLSQVNWASFRVGDVRFRKFVDFIRSQILEPLFLAPIMRAWLDAAQASGRVRPLASVSVRWRWAPHEEMDRESTAQANRAELENGTVTFEQLCESLGTTMDEQIASAERSQEALSRAGLRLAWQSQASQ